MYSLYTGVFCGDMQIYRGLLRRHVDIQGSFVEKCRYTGLFCREMQGSFAEIHMALLQRYAHIVLFCRDIQRVFGRNIFVEIPDRCECG